MVQQYRGTPPPDVAAGPAADDELGASPVGAYGSRVDRYLDALDSVPGWLDPLDAWSLCEIDRAQANLGVVGDLLEVGAYCGKSAILLGLLRRERERFIVCDLFNAAETSAENQVENSRYYTGFSRSDFERQYLRFHAQLPELRVTSSVDLDQTELRGRCRLLHIDGSHNYEIVRHDIALSRASCVPEGVAVFDDWSQSHSPGAGAALWEEVSKGELTPAWLTDSKLFATWGPSRSVATVIDRLSGDGRLEAQWHHIMGHDIPRFTWRAPALVMPHQRAGARSSHLRDLGRQVRRGWHRVTRR